MKHKFLIIIIFVLVILALGFVCFGIHYIQGKHPMPITEEAQVDINNEEETTTKDLESNSEGQNPIVIFQVEENDITGYKITTNNETIHYNLQDGIWLVDDGIEQKNWNQELGEEIQKQLSSVKGIPVSTYPAIDNNKKKILLSVFLNDQEIKFSIWEDTEDNMYVTIQDDTSVVYLLTDTMELLVEKLRQ